MHQKLVVCVVGILLCTCWNNATAQRFIGFSVNYGDRLAFTPDYRGLLPRRNSFSPTIVYHYEKKFRSNFTLLFGGQTGIAGYQIVPVTRDTISGGSDGNVFADYGILVTRLEVTPGKVIHINKKELFVGIGGGLSFYKFFFQGSGAGVSVVRNGQFYQTFSSGINAPASGTLNPFVKIYFKMPVSPRLDIAFQYSRHFKSIAQGEYEFYHTRQPASGTIKLVPQGASVVILYRLKNFKSSNP